MRGVTVPLLFLTMPHTWVCRRSHHHLCFHFSLLHFTVCLPPCNPPPFTFSSVSICSHSVFCSLSSSRHHRSQGARVCVFGEGGESEFAASVFPLLLPSLSPSHFLPGPRGQRLRSPSFLPSPSPSLPKLFPSFSSSLSAALLPWVQVVKDDALLWLLHGCRHPRGRVAGASVCWM